jgi:uncharacterized membrane protein
MVMDFYTVSELAGAEPNKTWVQDLNATGDVFGFADPADWIGKQTVGMVNVKATAWRQGSILTLPSLWDVSFAWAANDDGAVVGEYRNWSSGPFRAGSYILDSAGAVELAAAIDYPNDLNNQGDVVGVLPGGRSFRVNRASPNDIEDLGLPIGHQWAHAQSTNDAGQVAGMSGPDLGTGTVHLFLHDGAIHDLGPVTDVKDINEHGVIVGRRGVDAGGDAAYLTASI